MAAMDEIQSEFADLDLEVTDEDVLGELAVLCQRYKISCEYFAFATVGLAWVPDSGAALYFPTSSGQLGSRHSPSSVTPLTSAPSHLASGRGTNGAGKSVRL